VWGNGGSYLLKVLPLPITAWEVKLIVGPNVTRGYYKNPEQDASAIEGEWLHTGDIAIVDEEGKVFIVDRLKVIPNEMGANSRN